MSSDRGSSQKIADQAGIVGFWPELGRYTISFSPAGAYDTQYTCILNGEMPEGFRQQGMRVCFSGTIARDAQTPPPRLGGEATFWLSLSAIHPDSPAR
jgi:hypothetical protein